MIPDDDASPVANPAAPRRVSFSDASVVPPDDDAPSPPLRVDSDVPSLRVLPTPTTPVVPPAPVPESSSPPTLPCKYPLGTGVRKYFNAKPYLGRVIAYDSAEGFYKIRYEDEDEEELTDLEVAAILCDNPQPTSPTYVTTSKKRSRRKRKRRESATTGQQANQATHTRVVRRQRRRRRQRANKSLALSAVPYTDDPSTYYDLLKSFKLKF